MQKLLRNISCGGLMPQPGAETVKCKAAIRFVGSRYRDEATQSGKSGAVTANQLLYNHA